MDFTPGSENRKILNQEFNQDKYKDFRDWYFTNHNPDQLIEYKTQYYQHLEFYQKLIPFVEWYQTVSQPQLNAIEDQYKTWTTTEGQAINAIHPPPQALELAPNGETTRQPLLATAYIDAQSGKFAKTDYIKLVDLGLTVKQHNYTNLICQTMSKQLTRIEEAISTFKDRSLALPVTGSSTLHPVSIKPPLEVTNFKLKASSIEFMDTLLHKMQTLNVRPPEPIPPPPGQSSGLVQMLRAESTPDDNLSPDQIYEIQMNFQEPSSVNKLHSYSSSRPAMLPPSRNYYARPTPLDVLYEETYINDQRSYHGNINNKFRSKLHTSVNRYNTTIRNIMT
ncbi:unnamed protein product [Camellia sinensis]